MAGASTTEHDEPGPTKAPGQQPAIPSLPIPMTPLLGREAEIDAVLALLDSGNTRLLTLTGPGGVGKTRLAIEVARRVEPDFADGVCFVPLAPVSDPALAMPAVARSLGVRKRDTRDLLDSLIDAVRDRHLLLALDNFEHLLTDTPGWLTALLGAAPRLTALVTSRVPLNVVGEQRYLVSPFTVPGPDTPELVRGNAAVALFTQRAHAMNPDFVLDTANAGTVVEICRRLDGLALAIELAASRVSVLTPEQILARLNDRLTLLAGGQRDAPARHRSIREAIAWSYDLLSAEAQSAFRRLSVFTGGVSLGATATVTGHDAGDTIAIVAELADHNLIRPVASASAEPRYDMLETIREFGLDQLKSHDEERSARDAHAAWCLQLGMSAIVGLNGPDQVAWLNLLETEHANHRVATEWLMAEDRVEAAVELSSNLYLFFMLRGYYHEKAALFDAFIHHPRLASPTISRAKVLLALGEVAQTRGDLDHALTLLEEALQLFIDNQHKAGEFAVRAHGVMGRVFIARGELDRAETAFTACREIGEETGDARHIGLALYNLGIIAMLNGDVDAAKRWQEETVRVSRDAGDVWITASAYLYLGQLAFLRGDDAEAETLLIRCQLMFTELGNRLDQPKIQMRLAELALRRDDVDTAMRCLEDGLTAARAIGERYFVAHFLLALGTQSARRHEYRSGATRVGEALTLFEELGLMAEVAECLNVFADLATDNGFGREAARLRSVAAELRKRHGSMHPFGAALDSNRPVRHALSEDRQPLGDAVYPESGTGGRHMQLDAAIGVARELERQVAERSDAARFQGGADQAGLTEREREVLRLLADGLSNQEIADAMFVSRRTAGSHIEHILTKLDMRSRTAAVAYAIRNGLA